MGRSADLEIDFQVWNAIAFHLIIVLGWFKIVLNIPILKVKTSKQDPRVKVMHVLWHHRYWNWDMCNCAFSLKKLHPKTISKSSIQFWSEDLISDRCRILKKPDNFVQIISNQLYLFGNFMLYLYSKINLKITKV